MGDCNCKSRKENHQDQQLLLSSGANVIKKGALSQWPAGLLWEEPLRLASGKRHSDRAMQASSQTPRARSSLDATERLKVPKMVVLLVKLAEIPRAVEGLARLWLAHPSSCKRRTGYSGERRQSDKAAVTGLNHSSPSFFLLVPASGV